MDFADSITLDHGEAQIIQFHVTLRPPAVVVLLENTARLQLSAYPLDRADVVVQAQSSGPGVDDALRPGLRWLWPACWRSSSVGSPSPAQIRAPLRLRTALSIRWPEVCQASIVRLSASACREAKP